MASVVDICNRALQKVGARAISALTDQTASARACLTAYSAIRRAELRKQDWNFSIKRASLAADVPAPDWGRANSFTLPVDFIRLADDYPERAGDSAGLVGISISYSSNFSGVKDWVIEGGKVITNDAAPLQIRYVADIEDPTLWDSLFTELVSTSLALEICESLTQSRSKKADLAIQYENLSNETKKADSMEVVPNDPPPDSWVTVRD